MPVLIVCAVQRGAMWTAVTLTRSTLDCWLLDAAGGGAGGGGEPCARCLWSVDVPLALTRFSGVAQGAALRAARVADALCVLCAAQRNANERAQGGGDGGGEAAPGWRLALAWFRLPDEASAGAQSCARLASSSTRCMRVGEGTCWLSLCFDARCENSATVRLKPTQPSMLHRCSEPLQSWPQSGPCRCRRAAGAASLPRPRRPCARGACARASCPRLAPRCAARSAHPRHHRTYIHATTGHAVQRVHHCARAAGRRPRWHRAGHCQRARHERHQPRQHRRNCHRHALLRVARDRWRWWRSGVA